MSIRVNTSFCILHPLTFYYLGFFHFIFSYFLASLSLFTYIRRPLPPPLPISFPPFLPPLPLVLSLPPLLTPFTPPSLSISLTCLLFLPPLPSYYIPPSIPLPSLTLSQHINNSTYIPIFLQFSFLILLPSSFSFPYSPLPSIRSLLRGGGVTHAPVCDLVCNYSPLDTRQVTLGSCGVQNRGLLFFLIFFTLCICV